jgi:hypothetical protein
MRFPQEVVARIVATLREDQGSAANGIDAQRNRFEQRLTSIRKRVDQAYSDKLDGTIPLDFWTRKTAEWRAEEQQVRMALDGLKYANLSDRAVSAQKIFELANSAYSLYVSQNSTEQAKLLKMVLSTAL